MRGGGCAAAAAGSGPRTVWPPPPVPRTGSPRTERIRWRENRRLSRFWAVPPPKLAAHRAVVPCLYQRRLVVKDALFLSGAVDCAGALPTETPGGRRPARWRASDCHSPAAQLPKIKPL